MGKAPVKPTAAQQTNKRIQTASGCYVRLLLMPCGEVSAAAMHVSWALLGGCKQRQRQ
jgi:hypothetical protein